MLIRMQFRKTKEGRFLSHLDLMHTWERVIRRSQLPLAYSQGFHPHPKMNFASAVAVGTTSDGEYMDMELSKELPLEEVAGILRQAMPPAFEVTALKQVSGKVPSLMSIIERGRYRLWVEFVEPATQAACEEAVEMFWKQEDVFVYRYKKNSKEKKQVNIRPGVYELHVQADGKQGQVEILVRSGNEGNIRPEEVVYGLMSTGLPSVQEIVRIHREGLFLLGKNEELQTPMDVV